MEELLKKKIDIIISDIQGKSLAIYPCGKRCSCVVDYLKNQYNLSIELKIDNRKEHCTRTHELRNINCNDYIFLIASDARDYYWEIRKEIRRYVPESNIIDLFPFPKKRCKEMKFSNKSKRRKILIFLDNPKKRVLNWFLRKTLYPHGKEAFLHTVKNSIGTKILDVGCGNGSPMYVKGIVNKAYYVGIDVGDYYQTKDTKKYANEYHLVNSELFAEKIEEYEDAFDVVISSHNLEHCDQPERVLIAMIRALKRGGKLYLAFPSEESQYFLEGGRIGCLNFYDDCTHQNVPNWEKINMILEKEGMKTIFKTKNNQPFLMRVIGKLNEAKSKELKTVLLGTWEYYGFESILWCQKR